MNRILKFRAWDTVNKKWAFEEFNLLGEVMLFSLLEQYKLEEHADLEITQFTGRLDKDGNDIYEKDILCVEFEKSRFLNAFEIYHKRWTHVVKWDGKGFNIPEIEPIFREAIATAVHNQDKPTPKWVKIGNIYQDENLLLP